MRETIDGALEEFVAQGGRTRGSAPTFATDEEEQSTENQTMLEWPPKPRTPSGTDEHDQQPHTEAVAADE